MSSSALPPPVLVADQAGLDRLARDLATQPVVAVDTESNSLHAYRERVCLVQFSTPAADIILDPLAVRGLEVLAPFFANPGQQKIFHAAEGDLIGLRRDFGFSFANIFDTMSAARTLGWPQAGLAAILAKEFDVTMNKAFQRADWQRRPLPPEQLDYARLDTHYLIALRDRQFEALNAAGRWAEAEEEFERLSRARAETPGGAVERGFWRVKGSRNLAPGQAAILRAVYEYRERQAERIDRPPFKVMGEPTLLALAVQAPRSEDELRGIPGMTPDQVRRHGRALLQAIEEGRRAAPETPPDLDREPDDVIERYDRLRAWRRDKARARGVESDVIIPRTALLDMARRQPRTADDLAAITDLGPWRRQAYQAELLAVLAAPPEPGR